MQHPVALEDVPEGFKFSNRKDGVDFVKTGNFQGLYHGIKVARTEETFRAPRAIVWVKTLTWVEVVKTCKPWAVSVGFAGEVDPAWYMVFDDRDSAMNFSRDRSVGFMHWENEDGWSIGELDNGGIYKGEQVDLRASRHLVQADTEP